MIRRSFPLQGSLLIKYRIETFLSYIHHEIVVDIVLVKVVEYGRIHPFVRSSILWMLVSNYLNELLDS